MNSILELLTADEDSDEGTYSLDEIKQKYEVEELIKEDMWVAYKRDGGSLIFAFFSFSSSAMDGQNTRGDCFWSGKGYEDALRECRHSYLGDDEGYVYYMKFKHMRKALDWLEQYFDGD